MGLLGKKFAETVCQFNGNPIILDIKPRSIATDFKKKLVSQYSRDVRYFKVNITNEKSIISLSKKLKTLNIRGLVNNAAINPTSNKLKKNNLLENFSLDQLQYEFDVGLKGSLICTKVFGKIMARKKVGSIVNISSDLGIIAPNQSIYNKSKLIFRNVKPVSYSIIKSGIIGLTKYTSSYWGKDNVRCNALAPAGVYDGQDREFVNKLRSLIPINRMLEIDELSGSIIFLLSNASSYVNGHTLLIDGGRTIW